ncbi:EAL domain-containing protein [Sulfurimonas sp.]|uniref:EAL and HDOD domain-containing protein n=1 Tax=Sulfurimonas sp. TaxID=2022749 RepID=UPI0025CE8E60|nr:EAL domain-containing protein [Sulfurimonas sp.]
MDIDNLDKVYLAKQKVFNRHNKKFAYELLFRDYEYGIRLFPTNIKATSHVLINVLTNINHVINEPGTILINVDEEFLLSGFIDILDKNKFMLEILETTDLTKKVVSKIKSYHNQGYKIAIDDFDCSFEMIKKFTIKVDVQASEPVNFNNVVIKLKEKGLKLLAEKVETKKEYKMCFEMGFDLFQGYYLDKPQTVEIHRTKDITQYIVLNLIQMIKEEATTKVIEVYIKQRPDLSLKLVKFLNTQDKLDTKVESIVQVITLIGRDKLLRWLLLYLYSEMSNTPVSEMILAIAVNLAGNMEDHAIEAEKDKAYLAGMFSMIGALFDSTNKEVIGDIKLDKDIKDLVINRKGRFLSSLIKSEVSERT